MNRDLLEPFLGQTREFRAELVRFGSRNLGTIPTACFRDLIDIATGKYMADHIWVDWDMRSAKTGAEPGDILSFKSQVRIYRHHDGKDEGLLVPLVKTSCGLRYIRRAKIVRRHKMKESV